MDVKFKKVSFHKNEILFGHNSTPFITAVEHDGKNGMEVFFRKGDKITSEVQTFRPFLFLEDIEYAEGWNGTYEISELEGNEYFKYLVFLNDLTDLQHLMKYLKKTTCATPASFGAPF